MPIWTLIAAGLIIYAIMSAVRPLWGLYAILALLPAYQIRFALFGWPTTFLEGMLLVLAIIAIRQSLKLKTWKTKFKGLVWPIFFILLFVAAGIASVFVSPVFLKAAGVFKAYVLEGALFWLSCLLLIDSKTKLYRCLCSLGCLVVYLSLFGVYQFFTLYHLPPAWWGPGVEPRRIVSLFTYPNAVSLLITPILSMFTALVFLSQMRKESGGEEEDAFLPKSFLIMVNLSGIVLLVLTFSRGAWIGYIASVIFLLLFTKYKKTILIALGIGVLGLLAIPVSRSRLLPVFLGTDPAGQERFKLWHKAGEIIGASPVFGAGLMGFRDWYGALRQTNVDEILNYPHNFFLNFWVETGLFGLLAVISLLWWTGAKARKFYRQHLASRPLVIATLAAWVALVVHGQFDSPFFKNDLAILFWFLLAVIPALYAMNASQET